MEDITSHTGEARRVFAEIKVIDTGIIRTNGARYMGAPRGIMS